MAKRITDELLVSCSEHHDGSLDDLEELSLHQRHLLKMEYLNRVCPNVKQLYLQDNCISKIENTRRLRCLEYLNLSMNNVERIENLECCEGLRRLDLTMNFIGVLTDVERLRSNVHLVDLCLMGNPCASFSGYREFVLGALPRLITLDGLEVEPEEKIKAARAYRDPALRERIEEQEREYLEKREAEREEALKKIEEERLGYEDPGVDIGENRKRFYQSKSLHTPEYRLEMSRKECYFAEEDERSRDPFRDEDVEFMHLRKDRPRRLFDEDTGRPLNCNQPEIDFRYDDHHWRDIRVEMDVYKHLDPSLVELDVEPAYLRATLKDKVFQLVFFEEVRCDKATAERNSATGRIIVTVPRLKPGPRPKSPPGSDQKEEEKEDKSAFLEVTGKTAPDVSKIVSKDEEEEDEEEPPPPLEDANEED